MNVMGNSHIYHFSENKEENGCTLDQFRKLHFCVYILGNRTLAFALTLYKAAIFCAMR